MEIDDTDDKLRRNAVVTSSAVILAWWLKVDTPTVFGLTQQFLGASSWRIWASITVLIFYCLLRYHFSDQRILHGERLRRDHSARMNKAASRCVQRILAEERNTRISEKLGTATTTLQRRFFKARDVTLKEMHQQNWREFWYRAQWSDDQHGELEARYGDPENGDSKQITITSALYVNFSTWLGTFFWSRGFFEMLIPYLLSIVALSISCAKTVNLFE